MIHILSLYHHFSLLLLLNQLTFLSLSPPLPFLSSSYHLHTITQSFSSFVIHTVQSRAPTSVFQNWGVASQDSPSESENDEVDQASIPKSNSFGPVLHEVVEHFKEGDKMIIKNKKDSKSEKE